MRSTSSTIALLLTFVLSISSFGLQLRSIVGHGGINISSNILSNSNLYIFIIIGFSTRLFAHHPEKKIIRKKMDRRPIKHRLSDINRKNVNLDKCITKIENAPADYTIISAEGQT
jgi:hypothetical protein